MFDKVTRPPVARFSWVHDEHEECTMCPSFKQDISQERLRQPIYYENILPLNNEKVKFNDWPFAIFFIIVLAGFIAIASLVLRDPVQDYLQSDPSIFHGSDDKGSLNNILLLSLCSVNALFFASLGFAFCQLFPAFFIYWGMIINILSALGITFMFLLLKNWTAGIIFLVLTLIGAWYYWSVWTRISFSVTILKATVFAIKQTPQTLLVSMIGSIVGFIFSFLFSAIVVATYMAYGRTTSGANDYANEYYCSRSKLVGGLVIVFFCGFYISEVIRNIIHCTVSGAIGSRHYVLNQKIDGPKWPVIQSFRKSVTYCFGSICFGSLIVSVIETFKQFLRLVRKTLQLDGNLDGCGSVGLFAIDVFISSLEFLVRYFNHYAYCSVILYGKPYLKAAKETWYMMKDRGLETIINDNLVNIALGLYSLSAGYMSAFFACLYLKSTRPEYNILTGFNASIMVISFFIALQICNIVNETIRSGMSTLLVALGNDPELFRVNYPRRFDEILKKYPNMLNTLKREDA